MVNNYYFYLIHSNSLFFFLIKVRFGDFDSVGLMFVFSREILVTANRRYRAKERKGFGVGKSIVAEIPITEGGSLD